ncbi:MAG: SGNH/GDSL hydrolase family protein [Hyphomicrobiales bacterium]
MTPAAWAGNDDPCRAPAELVAIGGDLPHLAAALADGEPVTIVALGSSSTQGAGASSKQACYPARLEAELRKRFPGKSISVVNMGIGGQLAGDMVARIGKQVLPLKPQLVIWQTGVNDPLRGVALDAFRGEVLEGLKLLRGADADVVLLDQQFYPKSAALPAYGRFVSALADISGEQEVPLMRRYAIMQHLVSSEQYRIADMLSPDGFHQNDEGYRCLGALMAEAIGRAVRPAPAVERPILHKASAGALPGR